MFETMINHAMLKHASILLCFMMWLHPYAGFAEDVPARVQETNPIKQSDGAWQSVRSFEETRYFSVAGPPMQEDADRAQAETKLFEDMVANYDDLEDEDDEYLFVVESLFDPDDTSRPASLRIDDVDDAEINREESFVSTSIYFDSVRPTFPPGFQIKPRILEPDKKDVATARSLFADILKPKAEDVMNDDVKPILAMGEDKHGKDTPADDTANTAADKSIKTDDKAVKAGTINAPPKQRTVSPDEETLNQLKQAVKELGLEKRLNLGNGVDGHNVLGNKNEEGQTAQANNTPSTQATSIAASAQKSGAPRKAGTWVKKKSTKMRKHGHLKKSPEAAPAPAPPPKEESIFDIF